MEYTYQGISTLQVEEGVHLVLFSAPAHEIQQWAGIPQRQLWGNEEPIGFQRDLSASRVGQLAEFYAVDRNVMQNPLLAATQQDKQVAWSPTEATPSAASRTQLGKITISTADLSDLPLLEVMERVLSRLEERDHALKDAPPPQERIDQLKAIFDRSQPDILDEEAPWEENNDDSSPEDYGEVLFDTESHIHRFWIELRARVQILRDLERPYTESSVLGFSREALEAYLQPVLLVDGQHRLAGAVAALEKTLNSRSTREAMAESVVDGTDAEQVRLDTRARFARHLPVSMLMTAESAEHVFQFVVVNQRATPIRPALLGSIVATSLADRELDAVASRLRQAGIPLEESRAISFMTRRPESPFFGRVRRGLGDEGSGLLDWTVMGNLIGVFRNLRGGRLWGQRPDHADRWRRRRLPESDIASSYASNGFETRDQYWSSADGPWRECFINFWNSVKDRLGSDDDQAPNYWGDPRQSNLFNKVTLHILQADFFQYMCDKEVNINSADQVITLVDNWLSEVNPQYFSRDWKLSGIKKDSTGIRNQWAILWTDYRKDPVRMPSPAAFRKPLVSQ
ncbi:hypothetical protein [Amycolatopsis vastitatis]|uniref:hypothetical protein n=1 Tax=Amycolatopsis vastitatis TaxID=1905142 RepID=UPI0011781D33|nr:hypothetical protein [Amycolatopsis vastitatis]